MCLAGFPSSRIVWHPAGPIYGPDMLLGRGFCRGPEWGFWSDRHPIRGTSSRADRLVTSAGFEPASTQPRRGCSVHLSYEGRYRVFVTTTRWGAGFVLGATPRGSYFGEPLLLSRFGGIPIPCIAFVSAVHPRHLSSPCRAARCIRGGRPLGLLSSAL